MSPDDQPDLQWAFKVTSEHHKQYTSNPSGKHLTDEARFYSQNTDRADEVYARASDTSIMDIGNTEISLKPDELKYLMECEFEIGQMDIENQAPSTSSSSPENVNSTELTQSEDSEMVEGLKLITEEEEPYSKNGGENDTISLKYFGHTTDCKLKLLQNLKFKGLEDLRCPVVHSDFEPELWMKI